MASCGNTPEKNNTPAEDLEAKKTIQGIWVDELEGDCVFRAKGDTIFYTDSLSEPVKFHICADTLYLESSHPAKYHLNKLSDHVLRFVAGILKAAGPGQDLVDPPVDLIL